MELEAQEGEWNFQGRDDVMVSIRKLQQTESEELCTGSLPQDGVITEERAGRCGEEVGRTLEGSGTPKAVTKAWGSGWSPQEVRVDAACQRWPHSTTQPAVPLRYFSRFKKTFNSPYEACFLSSSNAFTPVSSSLQVGHRACRARKENNSVKLY